MSFLAAQRRWRRGGHSSVDEAHPNHSNSGTSTGRTAAANSSTNSNRQSSPSSTSTTTNTNSTMEDLCRSLRENKLRTLSLGWNDTDVVRSDRAVQTLEKAWTRNHSVVAVSIGHRIGQSAVHHHVVSQEGGGTTTNSTSFTRSKTHKAAAAAASNTAATTASTLSSSSVAIPMHTRNRRLLCLTLDRLLAQKSSSQHILLSLRLVLDAWIPAHLLQAVLACHGKHLQTLELHGVTCRNIVTLSSSTSTTTTSDHTTTATESERTVDTVGSSTRSTATSSSTHNNNSTRSEYAAAPVVQRFLPSHKKQRNKKHNKQTHGRRQLRLQRGQGRISNTSTMSSSSSPPQSSSDCHPQSSRTTSASSRKIMHDINLVSVIMPQLTRLQAPLQSLKLMDCGLVDADIILLVQALSSSSVGGHAHHHHHTTSLSTLSLRSNRRLTGVGVQPLCQTSYITHTLDISLCDFNAKDATAIAQALQRRNTVLPRIVLCGNYQFDVAGLLQLVQPGVLQHVQALDLSFCELGESRTTRVLEQLAQSHGGGTRSGNNDSKTTTTPTPPPIALREICLQGCTVTGPSSRRALINVLTCPAVRIHTYRLNDPVETGKYWTTDALRQVAAVLPHNYDVETLAIDYMKTQPNVAVWDNDIQPWLDWNTLGRRVVVPGRTDITPQAWITAIGKAAAKDDFNVLYWFIRQSTHHF